MPSVLALGAHQKTTICLTRGDRAWVSPFVGDLDDPETLAFHEETLAHLRRVLDCEPVAVAHDLHPDFVTTRKAQELGLQTIAVQHHHAHVAAVLAEHGHTAPALGVALDGFGLGPQGELWGGELLLTAGPRFERLGHLAEIALPGGDLASRQPWRLGAAALFRMGREAEIARRYAPLGRVSVLLDMLRRGLHAPLTTSCGRWFDAAAALAGVCLYARYEGEAPMCFEGLVTRPRVIPGAWHLRAGVLDPLPLLEAILPLSAADAADAFHGTFAAALAAWIIEAAGLTGVRTVALSGGCMHNSVLLDELVPRLGAVGLRPLLPLALPPNDGAISLGQAWIAGQLVR
jgi:hydrogenase maturation protein HypF